MFKKSLIAVASLLAAVGTAEACSTLVIGKAVSETGNIIVAHNEDNGGIFADGFFNDGASWSPPTGAVKSSTLTAWR